MIDELLFERGHIFVQLRDRIDDFDNLIPEYYFTHILGLTGEIVDSDGSTYEVNYYNQLTGHTNINFILDRQTFETDTETYEVDELIVQCQGYVIEIDGRDVLSIYNYAVLSTEGTTQELKQKQVNRMKLSSFSYVKTAIDMLNKIDVALEQYPAFVNNIGSSGYGIQGIADKGYYCNLTFYSDGSGSSINMDGCHVAHEVAEATKEVLIKKRQQVVNWLEDHGVDCSADVVIAP